MQNGIATLEDSLAISYNTEQKNPHGLVLPGLQKLIVWSEVGHRNRYNHLESHCSDEEATFVAVGP